MHKTNKKNTLPHKEQTIQDHRPTSLSLKQLLRCFEPSHLRRVHEPKHGRTAHNSAASAGISIFFVFAFSG